MEQPISSRLKRCAKCRRLRPLDRFYRRLCTPDGLWNECKSCHSARREHNRKLHLLARPLPIGVNGRIRCSVLTAMEVAAQSPRTALQVFKTIHSMMFLAIEDQRVKAARAKKFDQTTNSLPYDERRELIDAIADSYPDHLRPSIIYPEDGTGPSS